MSDKYADKIEEVKRTKRHVYFNCSDKQLIYEANLNRNFKISWRKGDLHRISIGKWDKFNSYVRRVDITGKFRY